MAVRSIEQALARAVLADRPLNYSDQEIAAAEARIAARIAERAARIADRVARPGQPGAEAHSAEAHNTETHEADAEIAQYLAILCRTVVEQDGALQHMAGFLGGRVPEPEGARVLGCVLQLAGREDSARFWWQFAAGAGDGAAAYCLYLHHMTLGETWEAELWHRQADPQGHAQAAEEEEEAEDGSSPALVLRVLARLCGDRAYLTEVAAAVVHYVPDAVQFVDEIELPLPAADFAKRIEELTAAG
ncbi:hypothetical protein [Streptomyces litchfieldiae]|uniref:Uncharacterized protein n=1 Tax=Streptomyces litchfieldiae TaxID=3075543 RepID=A0ABU2MKA2_9ACTN|nr:hypothetical protein [Streptomyces sp. DSM 44938]MDT0342036.1 hypothetical protein [Streptomyces sp. DSM 44938]